MRLLLTITLKKETQSRGLIQWITDESYDWNAFFLAFTFPNVVAKKKRGHFAYTMGEEYSLNHLYTLNQSWVLLWLSLLNKLKVHNFCYYYSSLHPNMFFKKLERGDHRHYLKCRCWHTHFTVEPALPLTNVNRLSGLLMSERERRMGRRKERKEGMRWWRRRK